MAISRVKREPILFASSLLLSARFADKRPCIFNPFLFVEAKKEFQWFIDLIQCVKNHTSRCHVRSDYLRHLTNEMCGRVKKIPIEEATFGDMRYDAPFTLGSLCGDGWGESHFYSPARAP